MIANDGKCGCHQSIQQAYGAHKWAIAKEEKTSLRNTIAAQEQRRKLLSNVLTGGGGGDNASHQLKHLSPMALGGRLVVDPIRVDGEQVPASSPVFGGSPNAQVMRMENQLEEARQRRRKDMMELYGLHKGLGRPVGTFDEFCREQEIQGSISPIQHSNNNNNNSGASPQAKGSKLAKAATTAGKAATTPQRRTSIQRRRAPSSNLFAAPSNTPQHKPFTTSTSPARRGGSPVKPASRYY